MIFNIISKIKYINITDLHPEGDHCNDESNQSGDKDSSEGGESDSLGVIQGGTICPKGRVPELSIQSLEEPVK